jgi:hypothetical protein
MQGLKGPCITGFLINDRVSIQTSAITIKRNQFDLTSNTQFITIGSNNTNVLILQNYMSDGQTSYSGIQVTANNQNIVIASNYIARATAPNIVSAPATATLIMKNNVLFGAINIDNSTFQDNIIGDGTFAGDNNAVNNNIANGTQLDGLGSNNQASVDHEQCIRRDRQYGCTMEVKRRLSGAGGRGRRGRPRHVRRRRSLRAFRPAIYSGDLFF